MLQVLRDNLKYLSWVLWLVIAVFILFTFVDFGSAVPGVSPTSDAAVTVGDHEISYADFERAYRQTEDTYRQLYGDQFSGDTARQLGLPMQVLDGLVAEKILLSEADRMGLMVTDAELRNEILRFPAFQNSDGGFIGGDEYNRVLRQGGLTTDSFETLMRTELLTQKVRSVLSANIFVADSEIEDTYRRRTEQARIRFLKLPWASLDQSVEIQEDELLAHFEENREDFRIPEQRVIDYLLVNRRELQDSLTLEDGATRAYYDANPDEFNREEQIRARHILLQVNDQRTASEARSQLEDARRRLDNGADFAALAAELSDDPGSKTRGGDLGLFGRGDMVAPFDQAAFSAEIGEVVGPVETDFGLHLIEVLEKRPGGSVEFSLAEEGIRTRLLAERAQTAAEEKAREIVAALRDDPSAGLEAVAAEAVGVTFLTTIPFGRNDNVPGIGRAGQFTVAAFGLADAEISDPVSVPQGWAILSLKAVNEPRLPDLDDVRTEAEASLREAKLRRQAVERMAAEALRIADGGSLDAAASNLDLEVEESVLFGRDDAIGSLGLAPRVAEAALELDEGGVGGPVETADGSVLFEVVERRHFDSQQFAEEKGSTKEALESQRLNELLGTLLEERRSQMEIRYDPQLMANFGLDNPTTDS
jgi:peptidyl-prolyl cis-trans isomerase D